MTRLEHLLTIVAEECVEIAQRADKSLRFGINEVQPGQEATNTDRMLVEVGDLLGALDMACPLWWDHKGMRAARREKPERIEQSIVLAAKCGTLTKESGT